MLRLLTRVTLIFLFIFTLISCHSSSDSSPSILKTLKLTGWPSSCTTGRSIDTVAIVVVNKDIWGRIPPPPENICVVLSSPSSIKYNNDATSIDVSEHKCTPEKIAETLETKYNKKGPFYLTALVNGECTNTPAVGFANFNLDASSVATSGAPVITKGDDYSTLTLPNQPDSMQAEHFSSPNNTSKHYPDHFGTGKFD